MPQRIDCALFGLSASGGPNIIRLGHHQRFTASCTIARWASVPLTRCSYAPSTSQPMVPMSAQVRVG